MAQGAERHEIAERVRSLPSLRGTYASLLAEPVRAHAVQTPVQTSVGKKRSNSRGV